MKNYLCVVVFVSLLITQGCQKNDDQTSAAMLNEESKIEIVEKTVDRLSQAILNKNQAELEQICAEGLSYGHSSGVFQDKKTFIDDIINGPLTYLSIATEDQTIQFYEDLSIVRHTFVAKGINKGDTVNLRLGSAHLYKIDDEGNCKLVLRQGFKL